MENTKQSFGKFLLPGFLLLLGIVALLLGLAKDQTGKFILGGFTILMLGIASLMYSLGKIDKKLHRIISIVTIIGSLCFSFMDYRSVKADIDFVKAKKQIYSEVIQRMKDIRTVQIAHKKLNGTFIQGFDSLHTFLTEGEMPIIKAVGAVPDTLTEAEAIELGIVRRDTIYESMLNNLFANEKAMKNRDYTFNIDSIAFAAVSGVRFFMNSGFIDQSGGIKSPVFILKDMQPFDKRDTLMIGSMSESTTSGNWSGE